MSITDELRAWAKGSTLSSWTAEHLTVIADRIDAEYEEAITSVMNDALYHANEKDMAELGWIRLPKDADGEYIHVGDVMELVSYDEDYRPVIRTVDAVGEQVFFAWSKANGRYAQYEAHAYRHHHAPTVEDVLRELLFKAHIYDRREMELLPDLIAEYASKLKLAEEDA